MKKITIVLLAVISSLSACVVVDSPGHHDGDYRNHGSADHRDGRSGDNRNERDGEGREHSRDHQNRD